MNITDELREWAGQHKGWHLFDMQLNAIADRIDAEHESACGEAYSNGMKSIWLPNPTEYIRLPVDADGEYIHMDDVMESRTGFDLFPQFEVRAMRYDGDGWEVIDRLGDRYEPLGLRHYHAPTVEDVLREMLDAWGELPSNATNEAIIAEYAAKLQLKEDE